MGPPSSSSASRPATALAACPALPARSRTPTVPPSPTLSTTSPTGLTAPPLRLPGMNQAGNSQNTSLRPSIFAISVPLVYPGSSVASIGLPVVSDGVSGTLPALHILALGIRASSYVGATGAGPYPNISNWTGTYAARQDSATGTLGTSTIRIPVHVSVG